MNGPMLQIVRVWDLPTRVFHWTLTVSVIASVVTAKVGGNAMTWHIRLGLLAMALIAFRVLWGLVGGHWSRFASFLYGPRSVLAYLRGDSGAAGRFDVGHSPVGALSVFAFLALLGLQVTTGLVADDEIATTGPLNRFVSSATAGLATGWHKNIGQYLVIVLMVAHVAVVLYYLWRKQRNLITPMLSGDKQLPAGTPASADSWASRTLALLLMALCGAAAVGVSRLGG